MNWVGGTLSRLRGRDDKKIQREFFEKKRYEKNLDSIPIGMQSPTKKREFAISQDLLSLQTVLHTHSESNNRLYRQFKHPNMLDLKPKIGMKRTISYDFLQEPVLNEKCHRNESFQDLETPSNFLDIKRWRGEHKPSRTLGLSKANSCLRQFQVSEHKAFQREGVDYCEKENIYPNEGQNCDSILEEVVAVETEGNDDVIMEKENYIQWNQKVCKESNNAPGNSKWLEFLYGKNNANAEVGEIKPEITQADQTVHNPIVQQSLVSTNSTVSIIPQTFIREHSIEDLMEFERESIFRTKSSYSEDPYYLTLSSNRDSFKGYKRPRIDTCSSSLVHKVNSDKYTGFLDESVFATPTDVNITRPDGNLTENPLPYSNSSGMRSIREFIEDKTSKYDKYHDALTDEELMENNSDEDSSEEETIVNSPKVNPVKSKFVVPFVKKEQSPIPVQAPIQETRQISKSYDRFLQSLVAPNNSLENNVKISSTEIQKVDSNSVEEMNHPLLQNNDNINSLMMPISEWKAKELAVEINSPVTKELIKEHCHESVTREDKESILNDGSYAIECDENVKEYLVRINGNNAEKTVSAHLEADTNISETNSDIQSVTSDENNIELMSSSSQHLNEESNGEVFEPRLLEQDSNYEEHTNNNECNTDIQNTEDCVEIDHGLEENENEIETIFIPEEIKLETNIIIREIENEIVDTPNEIAPTTYNDSANNMEEITELQASSGPIEDNPDKLYIEYSNKNNGNTSQDCTQEVVSEEISQRIGNDNNTNNSTQQEPNRNQEVDSRENSQTNDRENNTNKCINQQETGSGETSEITENNTNKELRRDCIQELVSEETDIITDCIDIEEVGSEEVKLNENIDRDNNSFENAVIDVNEESCIPEVQETIVSFTDAGVQYSQQDKVTLLDKNVGPIPVTESKDCQTCLEMTEKDESQQADHQTQTEQLQENTKSQEIQTEELNHNNIGNQTDFLLIKFPITSDNDQIINTNNKFTQDEYENYILYQQQIIRALQEESKLKYPLQVANY